MKVSVITLGCKVNQYESQVMLSQLVKSGFSACDAVEDSDVVLINSCTVTAMSDHKVHQALHRARRKNPTALIVLAGCMPQAFPEAAAALYDADIVLGNSNRAALLPNILKFLASRQRIVDIVPHEKAPNFESMSVNRFFERTRAFIKIEDGCNRFCAYCIIPYARGRVRSKPIEELKNEINEIAANGYKEIVLTGINLSAYGQDIGLHLCDAVEAACVPGSIERVRLGSLEPEQLSEAVIARLSRQKKFCAQFHLSLQSGCDETLKRMNRHYDVQEYRTIVKNLRATFSDAAITTDIMVGFPGETDDEFQKSLDFVAEIGFAKVHVFAFSRRPGTKANDAPDQVTHEAKEQRSHIMIEATQKAKQAFFKRQLGVIEPVLFEGKCENGVYDGYTENYTPVKVNSGKNLCGQIVPVRIISVLNDCCIGEICV